MAFTFYYKSFIASQAEDAATSDDNNSNSNSINEDSNSNNNDDSYKILYNVINVADNVGLVAAATAATAAAAAATLGRLVHYGLPHYLYHITPLPSPFWRCLSAYASPHNCVQFLRTKLKGLLLANFATERGRIAGQEWKARIEREREGKNLTA